MSFERNKYTVDVMQEIKNQISKMQTYKLFSDDTGCSKSRTDKYVPDGKHCRHYKQEEQGQFRRIRSGKHRYIYFCTNSKSLKKKWVESLNYKIEPYPKGDNNPDYELGDFLKPELIKIS